MTDAKNQQPNLDAGQDEVAEEKPAKTEKDPLPKEVGGRSGPEPTRYGDWEKNGIISDF